CHGEISLAEAALPSSPAKTINSSLALIGLSRSVAQLPSIYFLTLAFNTNICAKQIAYNQINEKSPARAELFSLNNSMQHGETRLQARPAPAVSAPATWRTESHHSLAVPTGRFCQFPRPQSYPLPSHPAPAKCQLPRYSPFQNRRVLHRQSRAILLPDHH